MITEQAMKSLLVNPQSIRYLLHLIVAHLLAFFLSCADTRAQENNLALPKEPCLPDCFELSEVQSQKVNDGGIIQRYAYSFEEFVKNGSVFGTFDPDFDGGAVANTECITGTYARFTLGFSEEKKQNNEYPWQMLVSHPYYSNEAEPRETDQNIRWIFDKGEAFAETLRLMCYEPVESGWISMARWGRLNPDFDGLFMVRLTNANFGQEGRVTFGGEYLEEDSHTANFLADPETKSRIKSLGIPISSEIFGPNFPTPGYGESIYPSLYTMPKDRWLQEGEDAFNFRYYQDPEERKAFEVFLDENEKLLDVNGFPIHTLNMEMGPFVIDCMGRMYMRRPDLIFKTTHSEFIAGGAVAAAGLFQAAEGDLEYINSLSRNYNIPRSALSRLTDKFPTVRFEKPVQHPVEGKFAYQSWRCMPISLGPGDFFGNRHRQLDRYFVLPNSIPLTKGSAARGTLHLNVLDEILGMTVPLFEFVYVPETGTGNQSYQYSRSRSSRDFLVGDTVYFSMIELKIEDRKGSVATLTIDNCSSNTKSSAPELILSSALGSLDNRSAYPNPAQQYLNLPIADAGRSSIDELSLVDAAGKSYLPAWEPRTESVYIDISSIPQGLYVLCVKSGKEIREYKVVIAK